MIANPITSAIRRFAGRLRFPYLFLLTAALFVVDLFIPDLVPLADEILLGLGTLLLGSLKKRIRGDDQSSAEPTPGE